MTNKLEKIAKCVVMASMMAPALLGAGMAAYAIATKNPEIAVKYNDKIMAGIGFSLLLSTGYLGYLEARRPSNCDKSYVIFTNPNIKDLKEK